jgi:hypothetical protein
VVGHYSYRRKRLAGFLSRRSDANIPPSQMPKYAERRGGASGRGRVLDSYGIVGVCSSFMEGLRKR